MKGELVKLGKRGEKNGGKLYIESKGKIRLN